MCVFIVNFGALSLIGSYCDSPGGKLYELLSSFRMTKSDTCPYITTKLDFRVNLQIR